MLATRIKRAHKLHGQKLISVDLRKHEMAERADLFMRPKQGTDYVWLSAVAKYIIEQNWHDAKFIEKHVNFYPEYLKLLENFTLEFAEQETGISQETLIQVATMIHEADGTAICWGMGVTQNIAGSYTSIAIANLLLVTGNFMRPGAGAYPLRGHNNVQGAADMGTMPDIFPGYQPVTNDAIRSKFEAPTAYKFQASADWTTFKCWKPLRRVAQRYVYRWRRNGMGGCRLQSYPRNAGEFGFPCRSGCISEQDS